MTFDINFIVLLCLNLKIGEGENVQKYINIENDVLFQKVTQAYSEKNPSAPIRSRT